MQNLDFSLSFWTIIRDYAGTVLIYSLSLGLFYLYNERKKRRTPTGKKPKKPIFMLIFLSLIATVTITILTENGILEFKFGKLVSLDFYAGENTSLSIILISAIISMASISLIKKNNKNIIQYTIIALSFVSILLSTSYLHTQSYIITKNNLLIKTLEQSYYFYKRSDYQIEIIKLNDDLISEIRENSIKEIYKSGTERPQKYGLSEENAKTIFKISQDSLENYLRNFINSSTDEEILTLLDIYKPYHLSWLENAERLGCNESSMERAMRTPETFRLRQEFSKALFSLIRKVGTSRPPVFPNPQREDQVDKELDEVTYQLGLEEEIKKIKSSCKLVVFFYKSIQGLPPSIRAEYARSMLSELGPGFLF